MDYLYETEDSTFIWGIKANSDSPKSNANFATLNDFDITYLKNDGLYILGLELIYEFSTNEEEALYLRNILNSFTVWMLENHYDLNYKIDLYDVAYCGLNLNMQFESIEEAYAVFALLIGGYISRLELA